MKNLLGEHGPDRMLRHLARARLTHVSDFDAVHLFCFGGSAQRNSLEEGDVPLGLEAAANASISFEYSCNALTAADAHCH